MIARSGSAAAGRVAGVDSEEALAMLFSDGISVRQKWYRADNGNAGTETIGPHAMSLS